MYIYILFLFFFYYIFLIFLFIYLLFILFIYLVCVTRFQRGWNVTSIILQSWQHIISKWVIDNWKMNFWHISWYSIRIRLVFLHYYQITFRNDLCLWSECTIFVINSDFDVWSAVDVNKCVCMSYSFDRWWWWINPINPPSVTLSPGVSTIWSQ